MELVHLCTALMFGIATYSVQAQTCEPPTCFVNGTEEIQCNSCPTGYGVAVENKEFMTCSSSPPRNTKCEPCIGGVNFSDTNNPTSKCVDCLSCHRTKEVQTKECTIASDAVCACIEGSYYFDSGLDSCRPCTVCGEHKMEVTPCTPTQDRECGVRSTPVPTLANPTTEAPISNATSHSYSVTGISAGPGVPSKDPTNGTAIHTWVIVFIIFAIIAFLVLLGFWLYRNRHSQNSSDSSPNNDSTAFCSITIKNCCIGKQENKYDPCSTQLDRIRHDLNDAHLQMNGHANQVPRDREPNMELDRQDCAPRAVDEVDSPLSVIREALVLSTPKLDQLIIELDKPDDLGRNALMLAERHLELPPDRLNNGMRAVDVLHLWVQQGKTKEELVKALTNENMGRGDIAELLVEDSAES